MEKRQITISLMLNSVIVFLVMLGTFFSIFNFSFMGINGELVAEKHNMFTFFTIDSNILLGVFSLVLLIYEILYMVKKIDNIPRFTYILKYIGTVGTSLTLLTVLFYLIPIVGSQFYKLFVDSNLFFHLIIPVLAVISFVFFEFRNDIKFYFTFIGVIPMGLYSIYYCINAFSHMKDGKIPSVYDVYGFAQKGLGATFIVLIMMILFTYLISYLLYFFNRLIAKKHQ